MSSVSTLKLEQCFSQNDLLRNLPYHVRRQLFPLFNIELLPAGKLLFDSEIAQPRSIYFPLNRCIVSLFGTLISGEVADYCITGSEGVVGIGTLLCGFETLTGAIVQFEGLVLVCKSESLRNQFNNVIELRNSILRFSQVQTAQISQTVLCYRHHAVEQQLCRWLLQRYDRILSSRINTTHETIAKSLGVRREGVSDAAGTLQNLGLISCKRGRIEIIKLDGLIEKSCECYTKTKSVMEFWNE